jgi:hypothetical protein
MALPHDQRVPGYPEFTTTSDAYPHELYRNIMPEHEVQAFVEGNDTYDPIQKRWSTPKAPANADSLVHSIYLIFSSILGRFVKVPQPGVERVLENTCGIAECEEKDERGYRAYPLLAIQATGPSFQGTPCEPGAGLATSSSRVEYHQMATFFSLRLGNEAGGTEELVKEMEIHARYVAAHRLLGGASADLTPAEFFAVNRIDSTLGASP